MKRDAEEWCRAAYERAFKRAAYVGQNKYEGIPEAARVLNQLSGRAKFASCVMRRKGYMVEVAASSLLALDTTFKLTDTQRSNLEGAWLKGILWRPLLVTAEASADRWTLVSVKGIELAAFLATKGCNLAVQVIEPEDKPATQLGLEILRAGLFNSDGVHCPVHFAKATL
jgi:hypothetical protein